MRLFFLLFLRIGSCRGFFHNFNFDFLAIVKNRNELRSTSPISCSRLRLVHDEVMYRPGLNEDTFIPQAERYSTKDWLHNLMTIRSSALLKRIKGVLIVNTVWSILIYGINKFIGFNSPGSKAHGLLGGALGLLLVFRTNTAYNRYWEGRKIWERIVSGLRDLSRFVVIYSDVMPSTQLQRILHLLIAFPICLQEYVQGVRQPEKFHGILSDAEIRELDTVTNRPYFLSNRLAREVRLIPESSLFTSRERERMFKFVDEISRSIACCERIVQTPVPLPYARHTSRFLSLWCFTLPICMASEIGFYIIPFSSLVSWALFGILEIGMIIEEPFQSEFGLKLDVFVSTIRRDISELLHVTHASMYPLNIDSPVLKYEKPRRNRSSDSKDISGSGSGSGSEVTTDINSKAAMQATTSEDGNVKSEDGLYSSSFILKATDAPIAANTTANPANSTILSF